MGGFVRQDDSSRPEVHLASLLRERYPSALYVGVYANHDGKKALRQILRLLDSNGDGNLTAAEKEQARIIIYGHSWGGSQTVTLARQPAQQGIRVRLTIQIDSVPKFYQSGSHIPANVDRAINFYQSEGLLHRRSTIYAIDSDHTEILGSIRMTYKRRAINCDNYPWLIRTLSRPHYEIGNDPNVWNLVGFLIDSELSSETVAAQTSRNLLSIPLRGSTRSRHRTVSVKNLAFGTLGLLA